MISDDSFVQCIFDNAGYNTDTIDRKNTFHSMGGAMTVTPESALQTKNKIERLKKITPASEIGITCNIDLQILILGKSPGLPSSLLLTTRSTGRVDEF